MGATDSKLTFRKSVFRLYEDKTISVTENDFWELFWNLPESVDDIFSLIGANDIRRTRDTARENFEILIDKVLEKMQAILESSHFPSEQHSINHLLNCCRVMTRIMPFVFETDTPWEESFFWTPRQVEKPTTTNVEATADTKPEYDMLPCRGELLLTLTIQSLFLAGFTLPISFATKESKIVYAIWENGVGSSIPISTYKDNESNRTEVLRLLAVLLSKSMYVLPSQLLVREDPWLRFVAVQTERKIVLVTLCSLLNTVCNYDPTGWVPYNHVVVGGPREQLVSFCLTTLLILLDYRSPRQAADILRQHQHQQGEEGTITIDTVQPSTLPKTSVELEVFTPSMEDGHYPNEENAFRHYMSKLHRKKDFEFLMNGIHRLLINPMTAVNTYLPGSTKRVGCYIDVMMMCWRLIETNTRFTKYLVETDRVLDLTVALVFHAVENKDKLSQIGLVRMCAFMLQTLSFNKEFSEKLNKPFTTHSSLPSTIRLYAFHGTYADFLIISIFHLIATTQGRLSSLYPALILTIANISPYCINLGVTTVSKLMSLFQSMSSPTFLFADEYNFQLVAYLLETFNNIIRHTPQENSNLIYSVVLHHADFEKLQAMTFDDALVQVEKVRKMKEIRDEEGSTTVDQPEDTSVDASSSLATAKVTSVDAPLVTAEDASNVTESVAEDKSVVKESVDEDKSVVTEVLAEDKPVDAASAAAAAAAEDTSVKTDAMTTSGEGSVAKDTAETEDAAIEEKAEVAGETETKETTETMTTQTSEDDTAGEMNKEEPVKSTEGFQPTESWMAFWKEKLPLHVLLELIRDLLPQVEEKCKDANVTLDELMQFLKLHNYPPAAAGEQVMFMRKFQWGEALVIWFRSMMWGQNYVSSMKECGPWNGTHVKLFQIKQE
ncbi:high-temperature-induced dauer-formation protein-domain-containing protein [Mucor mucedo]|uniref:high-temperature-induced dauer-formation protein-domain-containing protein n=1 Tax=Mucor mucedo TaxID=29922 RepID=UPI0022212A67|nr:high-temperature-induced dauer-formation protein-domain-containing protein [Mucor mucedo]KAI7895805.1 high-temperature-induced dauer-formation protein-domain-containing protein [Mucor mucedo]